MSFIEVKNITKRFNDNLALDNVSFTIEQGEVFGLLGPNGAGKSTLINILCGLLKSSSGDILIQGNSVNKNPIKTKEFIGYVPQEIALHEKLTPMDNLKYWGQMYGLKGNLLKERIEEALELTGLKERSKEKVKNFSGGMKRRLNIACAIMHHPKLLIMDEPTVGIDPQSRNHILEFTKKMNENHGTTIIYTSHYMEEVEQICNKIAIVDLGKVIAKGTKKEIKRLISNETTINLTLEEIKEDIIFNLKELKGVKDCMYNTEERTLSIVALEDEYSIEKIMSELVKSKVGIKSMSVVEPNLETVFLSLTGKKLRD